MAKFRRSKSEIVVAIAVGFELVGCLNYGNRDVLYKVRMQAEKEN